MFGKRGRNSQSSAHGPTEKPAPRPAAAPAITAPLVTTAQNQPSRNEPSPVAPPPPSPTTRPKARDTDHAPTKAPAAATVPTPNVDAVTHFYQAKRLVYNTIIDQINMTQLLRLSPTEARTEIEEICYEVVKSERIGLKQSKIEAMIRQICDDIIGYGPITPLLSRDDISDIMVNGCSRIYIESEGKLHLTNIRFQDNIHLANVCQRIVSQIGRRVDEASPICDARLEDGSRVCVVFPPIAFKGPSLTIRKFRRNKLDLSDLVKYGSISFAAAETLRIAATCRCNILVSGGTGSGKTTMLNCLSRHIGEEERVVTCEDVAELNLDQTHVIALETRPKNLEGSGEVTMRDLVKTCLRMRPERIIVGEVRGAEAFDLLQAMNTGHDGSMGTIHANTPRDATRRIENMMAMGGFNLPTRMVREQIASAIDLIVQVQRLRDGSRRITHITEIVGTEDDVLLLQDLFTFEYKEQSKDGKIVGVHKPTGIRPKFMEKARYFNLESDLIRAMGE